MLILAVALVILIISFIFSLFSLRREMQKYEVEEIKKSFDKGRVIYHSGD